MRVKVTLLFMLIVLSQSLAKFEPNWDSLDTRRTPSWYDEAKVGIFIHWGVFSAPSLSSEWFWESWITEGNKEIVDYMSKYYPAKFSYQDFAREFTAEFFNARQWAQLFAKSGAKYVVLTSKHHEGFALWPSRYSYSWNAKDIGPLRDIVGELGEAVRAENLKFGLYHSLLEWFNPMFMADKANNYQTQEFVTKKTIPELYELVNNYHPSVLWSDGESGGSDNYWKSKEFLAWLYSDSPVKDEVIVNDRWGSQVKCHHGDFFTCTDRYNPGVLQDHKWENAMTIDKGSWGYRRNAVLSDYMTSLELITLLARTVSCGGNILINVGPTKDGMISPIYEERLTQLGDWLSINGESIYATNPWTSQNDTLSGNIWYTSKDKAVYAIILKWPTGNTVSLAAPVDIFSNSDTVVTLLGNEGNLKWVLSSDHVEISLPDKAIVKSETAWVLKIV